MKTYTIIKTTDPYNGSRHGMKKNFNGNFAFEVLASGLTLKEAQDTLLKHFSDDVDCYVANWGCAVNRRFATANLDENQSTKAYATFADGTRAYDEDIWKYRIWDAEVLESTYGLTE